MFSAESIVADDFAFERVSRELVSASIQDVSP